MAADKESGIPLSSSIRKQKRVKKRRRHAAQ
jgi:hypothetical protein